MVIAKNIAIPLRLSISLIDLVPYRFSSIYISYKYRTMYYSMYLTLPHSCSPRQLNVNIRWKLFIQYFANVITTGLWSFKCRQEWNLLPFTFVQSNCMLCGQMFQHVGGISTLWCDQCSGHVSTGRSIVLSWWNITKLWSASASTPSLRKPVFDFYPYLLHCPNLLLLCWWTVTYVLWEQSSWLHTAQKGSLLSPLLVLWNKPKNGKDPPGQMHGAHMWKQFFI